MTSTRPDTDTVVEALELYAESCRKAAAARYNAGDMLKAARAGLRAERDHAISLAGRFRRGEISIAVQENGYGNLHVLPAPVRRH